MPRCPNTCPKVQEQLRRLAQQQQQQQKSQQSQQQQQVKEAARESEESNTYYNEPSVDPEDSEVQTSDELPNLSAVREQAAAAQPSTSGTAIIRSKNSRIQSNLPSQYRTSYRSLVGTAIVSSHGAHSSHSAARVREKAPTKSQRMQAALDQYYLNKGLNYFEDICCCSLECLLAQAVKDKFIWSTVTSLVFCAFGIKLCCELDGWTIPNSFF